MKNRTLRFLFIPIIALLALSLQLSALSQTTPPPGIFTTVQNIFDAHDTNSLMHASEVNFNLSAKWDVANQLGGGMAKLDWWVSDQQGMFVSYEEYANRSAFWAIGYQARAVFKGFEVSLGLGSKQSTDDPLGDVKMFLVPTITKQIYAADGWDARVAIGCDIFNGRKPDPFVSLVIHAAKF